MKKEEEIKIDGKKQAAELLAHLQDADRERILLGIAKQNPELAILLRKNLFHFEQVLRLEPLDLMKVMAANPISLFALALRGLDPEMKKALYQKLSERQARNLEDEIASLGPQKKSDVKLAQEKVTEKARELHEKKEIELK